MTPAIEAILVDNIDAEDILTGDRSRLTTAIDEKRAEWIGVFVGWKRTVVGDEVERSGGKKWRFRSFEATD